MRTQSINIRVTNLSPADAQFLRAVLGLFCDPNQKHKAEAVRSGRECIQYQPDGMAMLIPLWIPGQPQPKPLAPRSQP